MHFESSTAPAFRRQNGTELRQLDPPWIPHDLEREKRQRPICYKPLPLNALHGGGERDRTDDLMTASHALSQLSYTPTGGRPLSRGKRAVV